MSKKISLSQLTSAQKDQLLDELISKLGFELVDKAEWGEPIVELEPKNSVDDGQYIEYGYYAPQGSILTRLKAVEEKLG